MLQPTDGLPGMTRPRSGALGTNGTPRCWPGAAGSRRSRATARAGAWTAVPPGGPADDPAENPGVQAENRDGLPEAQDDSDSPPKGSTPPAKAPIDPTTALHGSKAVLDGLVTDLSGRKAVLNGPKTVLSDPKKVLNGLTAAPDSRTGPGTRTAPDGRMPALGHPLRASGGAVRVPGSRAAGVPAAPAAPRAPDASTMASARRTAVLGGSIVGLRASAAVSGGSTMGSAGLMGHQAG